MVRMLASATLALIGNAIGLIVASVVLDDMTLDAFSFLMALVIFSVVMMLIQPLLREQALRRVPALAGSTALVATLVSLIATVALSDGLQISGALTWVLATVVVWLCALVARLLLPLVLFKKVLGEARNR